MVAGNRSYHHGNLRVELITAGLELTRADGPAALSLREATRAVGVSPNAAYRHFANRDALLAAVAADVQDLMADAMRRHWPSGRGRRAARARVRAVGMGYIDFALAEPGWFATFLSYAGADAEVTAFGPQSDPSDPDDPATRVPPPFALLQEALDQMVASGLLSPAARRDAEWPCWSAAQGFAQLASQGPLRHRAERDVRRLAGETVDAIIDGVLARTG